MYHWVHSRSEKWNWFIGPGAQTGFYYDYEDAHGSIILNLGMQVGFERDFNNLDIPLTLSFDTRPMIKLLGSRRFDNGGAISLRYTL